jgi:hypothetical protein
MLLRTSVIVRAARTLMPVVLLLVLGTLHTAPTVLASPAHKAPAGLGTVLLKVQSSVRLPGLPLFSPTNPNFTRIGAGHAPRIVLYAYFSGITTPVTVHVSFVARRGQTRVLIGGGTFTVGRAQLGGASSGWRWYWNDIGSITTKPGQLTFRAAINAGGVTQVRETSLTLF